MSRFANVFFILSCALLFHDHTEANRHAGSDRNRVTLLPELGMAKHDLMRTERQRDVSERRVAGALAVNPDFGPRARVELHDTARPLQRQRGALAGRAL